MAPAPDDSPLHPSEVRQRAIYEKGVAGLKPDLPLDAVQLGNLAQKQLKPEVFDYVAGGAGAESTMHANRLAFDRWRIRPRMLRDVSRRSLAITLFGHQYETPILVAPVGVQSIIHPEADVASARAAAGLKVPFLLSTASSKTIEEVAQACGPSPRWFQLYPGKDADIARSFVSRAEAAGYSAIVVTVDTSTIGWRTRDLQNAYLPFLQGAGIANYTSDPVFRERLGVTGKIDPTAAIRLFTKIFGNPEYDWNALRHVRAHTKLPLLVKGITHPDDARLAVDLGLDGVIVSNHGGRQVDGAVGALDALPHVVEAVAGRIPVLFDSGIRDGADVFKALALGAKAVLFGRPWVYGLAIAGEAGVREVLLNLIASFDATLALSGKTGCEELGRGDLEFV